MEEFFHQRLGAGDGQFLFHHLICSLSLEVRLIEPEQRPGVALGAAVIPEQSQHVLRQAEEPEFIGHRRLGLAQTAGGFLLRKAVGVNETAEGGSLFHKVQISPLEVFDQGQQRGPLLVHAHQQAGDFLQPCQTGGPQAAFSGDQFISARQGAAHAQRLENTMASDGLGQFFQRVGRKGAAGLIGVGLDGVNRQKQHLAPLV